MTDSAPAPLHTATKAARTRQRIVEAAAGELARHGYRGTSLRHIAAAANLRLGSLYFHFTSKDELVLEALGEGIEFAVGRVTDALAELTADAPAAVRLETAMTAHLDALHTSHERAACVARMVATLPAELRQAQATNERRYGRIWLRLLEEAQDAGVIDDGLDLRVLRDIVLGALNSTLDLTRTFDKDQVVSTVLRLLLR